MSAMSDGSPLMQCQICLLVVYFTILQGICCFDCIILVKFWSCQHGRSVYRQT
uniref:Uncharacterized protein n=1 Tax=Romanomermis culicivorax TaxID=13658 RepID=A0A915K4M2_ROMCU